MIRRSIAFACLASLLSGAATAQQSTQSSNGFDFDTLAACSIVYQRIGELYYEKGDYQQASSFQDTAYAYSSSAFYMLQYSTSDQAAAYEYSEGRMQIIMDSLNQSSLSSSDGDMAVITEWLPYCDTLGSGVAELVSRRSAEGW